MFEGIFRNKYKKRTDGKEWTKNAAVQAIAKEMQEYNPVVVKNRMCIEGEDLTLRLNFISGNYTDVGELDLNASIEFVRGSKAVGFIDLFQIILKPLCSKSHRHLHIYKDQVWKSSGLRIEVIEIVKPILAVMLREESRTRFFNGEEVEQHGYKFKLPQGTKDGWLLKKTSSLNEVLKVR